MLKFLSIRKYFIHFYTEFSALFIRPFSETVSATVEWLASIGKIYIAKAS